MIDLETVENLIWTLVRLKLWKRGQHGKAHDNRLNRRQDEGDEREEPKTLVWLGPQLN